MCFAIAKYLMFTFNFVLFIAGAATLGVGVYVYQSPDGRIELHDISISKDGSFVLFAVGSVAFFVGFLGCRGAHGEDASLLGLYFVCVFVIVFLQLSVGVWALIKEVQIGDIVNEGLYKLDLNEEAGRDTLIKIQKQFSCCGLNASASEDICGDWEDAGMEEPLGCECEMGSFQCKQASELNCFLITASYEYIYAENCRDAIVLFIQDSMETIAAIGLSLGLIEIFALVFSMSLCLVVRERNK